MANIKLTDNVWDGSDTNIDHNSLMDNFGFGTGLTHSKVSFNYDGHGIVGRVMFFDDSDNFLGCLQIDHYKDLWGGSQIYAYDSSWQIIWKVNAV